MKYRPAIADRAATRCRRRPRERLATLDFELVGRIAAELRQGRSPVAIWADLVAEGAPVVPCVETIYQGVDSGALGVKATECLRSRRPRRRGRQIDQIIGGPNQSSMITFCERVTRYTFAITMSEGYDALATLAGLTEGLDRIPTGLLRSITFDQGSEWAEWETLAATHRIDVWFCDPHSPWQRGQIENQNRTWRWWFPRGMRLDNIDQTHVDQIADIINGQRRRSLAYHSPAELYDALTVH